MIGLTQQSASKTL